MARLTVITVVTMVDIMDIITITILTMHQQEDVLLEECLHHTDAVGVLPLTTTLLQDHPQAEEYPVVQEEYVVHL